jgi:hypothetical protein
MFLFMDIELPYHQSRDSPQFTLALDRFMRVSCNSSSGYLFLIVPSLMPLEWTTNHNKPSPFIMNKIAAVAGDDAV